MSLFAIYNSIAEFPGIFYISLYLCQFFCFFLIVLRNEPRWSLAWWVVCRPGIYGYKSLSDLEPCYGVMEFEEVGGFFCVSRFISCSYLYFSVLWWFICDSIVCIMMKRLLFAFSRNSFCVCLRFEIILFCYLIRVVEWIFLRTKIFRNHWNYLSWNIV